MVWGSHPHSQRGPHLLPFLTPEPRKAVATQLLAGRGRGEGRSLSQVEPGGLNLILINGAAGHFLGSEGRGEGPMLP